MASTAVTTMGMGLLRSGDHMVSHRGVFGTVVPLFDQILAKFGVTTTWVDLPDLDQWQAAIRPNTRLLFAETPSNPVCQLADIGVDVLLGSPLREGPPVPPGTLQAFSVVTESGREVLRSRRTARAQLLARGLESHFTAAELRQLATAAPLLERLAQNL